MTRVVVVLGKVVVVVDSTGIGAAGGGLGNTVINVDLV
jgi:hypothetical protein